MDDIAGLGLGPTGSDDTLMAPPELVIFALAAFGLGLAALAFLGITIGRGVLRSRVRRERAALGSVGRRRLSIGVVIVMTGEIALYLLWPLLDDNDAPPTAEHQLAIAAALLLFALPHVIAWLGRGYPHLLTVAGAFGILLTVMSVMGHSLIFFTLPFVLIPSVFYLARGLSRRPPAAIVARSITVVTVLGFGAAAAFFLTQDPRCSTSVRRNGEIVHTQPKTCDAGTSGRTGGTVIGRSATSDTIALHESLLSLSLSSLAVAWCMCTAEEAPPAPGISLGKTRT